MGAEIIRTECDGEPVVMATITVVFDRGYLEVTPGERGLGKIRILDSTRVTIWETKNIPDDFWYQLHGILQAKGFSS